MNLNGTFTFNGPRAAVWDLLQDPAVLAKALPGAKTLTQTGPDQYDGKMKVSVGPVTAAEFAVTVTLHDKVPLQSFGMQIDGKGALGFTRGTASIYGSGTVRRSGRTSPRDASCTPTGGCGSPGPACWSPTT